MDSIHATLLDAVSALFLTEAWGITGQCLWQILFIGDRINKFTDHRMLTCTDQEQIFALDLVHHRIHFRKTHNTGHDIASNHVWRNAVSETTIDHEISCIGKYSRMQSGNVTHQIIETISCHFTGSINV